jgi:hypothetical protein
VGAPRGSALGPPAPCRAGAGGGELDLEHRTGGTRGREGKVAAVPLDKLAGDGKTQPRPVGTP